jgi:hypothetical protein
MLYSKKELENFTEEDEQIAIFRYINKIKKDETKRLLPHECEFLCRHLPYYTTERTLEKPIVNIYNLNFLNEALFKRLILLYLDNLDFIKPVEIGTRSLTDEEIKRDKQKFEHLINYWNQELTTGKKDPYLHEVRIEYNRKMKLLAKFYKRGAFGKHLYERRITEQTTASFYVYFLVKSFFRNQSKNYLDFQVSDKNFSINIYSYVHILSRHYMPKFNSIDVDRSFNSILKNVDVFNVPTSLRLLIEDYLCNAPQDYEFNEEYMIFREASEFYIIWWKQSKLPELNHLIGYEIRTLYKIQAERDKLKINKDRFFYKTEDLTYYY